MQVRRGNNKMKIVVAGTDDLREVPSIPNVRRLLDEGGEIVAYDPVGEENFKRLYPTQITYVNSPDEILKGTDIAFIFTEWNEIKDLDLNVYVENMKTPIIYDDRNCYDLNKVREFGIEYYSIGRNAILKLNKNSIQEKLSFNC